MNRYLVVIFVNTSHGAAVHSLEVNTNLTAKELGDSIWDGRDWVSVSVTKLN